MIRLEIFFLVLIIYYKINNLLFLVDFYLNEWFKKRKIKNYLLLFVSINDCFVLWYCV